MRCRRSSIYNTRTVTGEPGSRCEEMSSPSGSSEVWIKPYAARDLRRCCRWRSRRMALRQAIQRVRSRSDNENRPGWPSPAPRVPARTRSGVVPMFESQRTQVRNWGRFPTSTSTRDAVAPLPSSQCWMHPSDIYHLDILYHEEICESSLPRICERASTAAGGERGT